MKGQRVVFVSGHFNVLHPGHLRLLRFAKEYGGHLVVGVMSDKFAGTAAYVLEDLRLECIQSNSWVDEAFILDEPVQDIIEKLRPDIVVKGKEHELRFNAEFEALAKYGGRLLFSSGESVFSSLDLIRKEFYELDSHSIKIPSEYLIRHNIDQKKLAELVLKFSKLKVCVIGDLIIDEYITCQPLGMSQEEPTLVVTPIDSIRFIGGAGIVAAHASGLGASVNFISIAGVDTAKNFAKEKLLEAGISAFLIEDDSRPTTLKQRFRSKGKSLLRVSHLHQGAISVQQQASILKELEGIIKDIDLLVFSDFNYGCLPQVLVDQIVSMAKTHGVMMSADSQSSSQVGNVSRYQNMNLLTPTEFEARISTRNHEDGLVVLAEQVRQLSGAENILLKLGEEGFIIHAGDKAKNSWQTDRLAALNSSPKDVAGAGDSLLITSSMALACGGSIWEAAFLGSLAASVQVGRVGNSPLRIKEILQELV